MTPNTGQLSLSGSEPSLPALIVPPPPLSAELPEPAVPMLQIPALLPALLPGAPLLPDGPAPLHQPPTGPRPIAREHTIDTFTDVPRHYCGKMDQICQYCGARYFKLEQNTKKQYTACCSNGQVRLPDISPPTPAVEELLLGISPRSKNINKRTINTACAMASVTMEHSTFSAGTPSLLIHGNVYHNLGPLTPAGTPPTFLQVYFHDGLPAAAAPVAITEKETTFINLLRTELQQNNAYLLHMHNAIQPVLPANDSIATAQRFSIQISDKPLDGEHRGIYNKPTAAEIACIIQGTETDLGPTQRSIIVKSHGDQIQRIKSNHTAYDPLSYPLTHVHGDKGWTFDIMKHKVQPDGSFLIGTKPVSPSDFYAYRLQIRDPVYLPDTVGQK